MADNGDRGMCHACGGVWLLDSGDRGQPEGSLTCPHCDSDFIEIVRRWWSGPSLDLVPAMKLHFLTCEFGVAD